MTWTFLYGGTFEITHIDPSKEYEFPLFKNQLPCSYLLKILIILKTGFYVQGR